MSIGSALAFAVFGAVRLHDAWVIVRYRRNIRRLPRDVMTSGAVPVSQQRLFIGRGFLWEQKHTHRRRGAGQPAAALYRARIPLGAKAHASIDANLPA